MFDRFKQRSYELEHLDKGDYTSEEYEGCIVELQLVNQWLGDASALRRRLLRELEGSKLRSFSFLDVGAGSGELLRVIGKWAQASGSSARLCGLEMNARSAFAIVDESRSFPEINAVRGDAFHLPFADDAFDYAICSLFTHHFTDENVVAVLRELDRVARRRICVIDLHRHPVAYYFYTTVGRLFLHNRLLREDGALSILRGFKPHELARLGEVAELENVEVDRYFPYRLVLTATRVHNAERGQEIATRKSAGKREAAA